MPGIDSIPRELIFLLANYLLPKKEQNKQVFNFSCDWLYLFSTSKKLFGEWKKQSRLVVMASFYAKRYSMSSLFRSRVRALINNPLEQLILQVDTVTYRFAIDVHNLSGILQLKAESSTIAVIPT
jgi:hypothetical protein